MHREDLLSWSKSSVTSWHTKPDISWFGRTRVRSIKIAVHKVRLALGDLGEQPRYVGTLVRRGYRPLVAAEREQARFDNKKGTGIAACARMMGQKSLETQT